MLNRSLGRGKTGKRDAEGRAGDVVEANSIVEFDGSSIATGLTADADKEILIGSAATLNGHLHEFADAVDINGLERIKFVDFAVVVVGEELAGVITGEAHGELGEVIGPEGEELSFFGKFASTDASAWDFDHHTDVVDELLAFFGHFVFDGVDDGLLRPAILFELAAERNHDLGLDVLANFLASSNGSLDDGTGKNRIDFGISDAETDATETHHRVGLMELVDAVADLLFADAELNRDFGDGLVVVDFGEEFV